MNGKAKNRRKNSLGWFRRNLFVILSCAGGLFAGQASAQMPHRVAVLINQNSQDSKKAANAFAALHGVPGINMIYLDIPESLVDGRAECTPDEFRSLIYEPAQELIAARGLDKQILAWVYSVDFPIRVLTSTSDRRQMSIQGLTFTRGIVPAPEMIEKGLFASSLFAGPVKEGGPKNPPRSFDIWQRGLQKKMPLPSMMLGYTGQNGSSIDTVLRCIADGMRARHTGKDARILLVKTDDEKRSGPREWQYTDVQAELARLGKSVVIYTNQPPPQTGLLGVMTGAENVNPSDFGTFTPGAFAEHLTSWSAEFQKPQTKCTAWLDAGATVTAGMVTEPYNTWVKFPHARFFTYYASGCSAMESFYQSIASPLQVLLLGDPLSQIAGLPTEIRAIGLRKTITSNLDEAFVAEAKFPIPVNVEYSALFDGRQIKEADPITLIELPFETAGDGYHEIRIIAQAQSPVTPGGFKDFPLFINKKGRSLAITDIANGEPHQIQIKASPGGEEKPQELFLLWNGRTLDRKPCTDDVTLSFDERTIGEGAHRIQAVAVYADGMEVRSEPKTFAIAYTPGEKSK